MTQIIYGTCQSVAIFIIFITTCHAVNPGSSCYWNVKQAAWTTVITVTATEGDKVVFQSDTILERNLSAKLIPTVRNHRMGCDWHKFGWYYVFHHHRKCNEFLENLAVNQRRVYISDTGGEIWIGQPQQESDQAWQKKKDKKEDKIQNSKPTISMDAREFIEAVTSFLIAEVVMYMKKWQAIYL